MGYKMVELGTLITQAKTIRCGDGDYPILSMTMHNGLVFQNEKFKKVVASNNRSDYKVVYRNQLVVSFPIDEGVLATQRIADIGIVSPAYTIWDVDQSKIVPEFLEYALRCRRSIEYYKAKLRGSTARRRSLPTPIFLAHAVPLPSVKEQKGILDVIHSAETVVKLRKAELQKLDELVKTRFVELFGAPRDNPSNFEKLTLKESCKIITGNTPSRTVSEYYGNYIEWIKTDNIVSGLSNPTRAIEGLSEKGSKAGRIVDRGSILMACIAGSTSSIGRVCITDRTVAFNQQINAIVPEKYNVLFLYVLLKISKDYLVENVNMALKGILSKSKLEEKVFIVPPIELQAQFAAFVTQTDKSKVAIQKALDEAQMLYDSLMQKFFG